MNRRSFVKNSGILSLGALATPTEWMNNAGLMKNVGLGLFSIPKMLDTDLNAAFSMLNKMGYTEVELFGPYTFSTEKARKSWEGAAKQLGFNGSGLFGKSTDELKKITKSYGISIPSMHTDLDTLSNNIGPLLDAANALGSKYVVLPAIPDENRKTLDDYKKTAALFNKIGADANKQGIRFADHNHGYGLQAKDGVMPLDIIFNETDPSLVYFEMDLYWTMAAGADPIKLLNKHKGRYTMMHVKDMKESKKFAGDGGDMMQWMALFPFMTSAGEGVFDLPTILKVAKDNGMKHFFVEQDLVAQPELALKKSIDYLKTL